MSARAHTSVCDQITEQLQWANTVAEIVAQGLGKLEERKGTHRLRSELHQRAVSESRERPPAQQATEPTHEMIPNPEAPWPAAKTQRR